MNMISGSWLKYSGRSFGQVRQVVIKCWSVQSIMSRYIFFENLVIALIQFIVSNVGITLCDSNVGVTRQLLRQLGVTGGAQHRCNEIMPEGMWCDAPLCIVSQCLAYALVDDVSPCGCG